ncbi:alpha/beta fold hydrolase [Flavobacterium hauense]
MKKTTNLTALILTIATQQSGAQSVSAVNSTTQFIEEKGKKLAYRSIGKGEAIILSNRFRGNLDDWDPAFLDALAENYQVITFDYSGLASSTGTPHDSAEDTAKDVIELADALGIKKFTMLGWSIGGFTAQAATALYPERIDQTILIGTKPPGKVNYPFEEIFQKKAWIYDYTLEDEVVLFFEPLSEKSRLAAKKSHDRLAQRTKGRDIKIKQELWQHYSNVAAGFENDPGKLREKIITTKVPLLIISGDHEICFPPENWFELNRKLETSQLIVMARSGHGPQHEYPQLTADYIHAFIKQNQ